MSKESRRKQPAVRRVGGSSVDADPAGGANAFRSQVESWLFSYISAEFHLPPGRISQDQELRLWGYGEESALAHLAGEFNRAAPRRPQWHDTFVTPPELIAGAGKTIGELINFLSAKLEGAAKAQLDSSISRTNALSSQLSINLAEEPPATSVLYKTVKNWTFSYLYDEFPPSSPDDITSKTALANLFRDSNSSLSALGAAFDYDVKNSQVFKGLVDPTKYCLGLSQFLAGVAGKTVGELITFLFKTAEAAAA